MFDPTNKEYQVTEEFQPDKESTWAYPKNEDGWVHAHNALRGEIQDFIDALDAIRQRRKPLLQWELQSIQSMAKVHLEHIHSHHKNEEDLFFPEMKKRFVVPDRLFADHEALEKKLEVLEGLIGKLQEGSAVDELLQEMIEYKELIFPHLQEEEDTSLPLSRAYFTAKEMAPLVQKVIANGSPYEIGSFIYYMDSNKFRSSFMKQEGIPSFVWYIDFNGKYKRFTKEFVVPAEALKSGNQPKVTAGWFGFLSALFNW